MKKLFVVLGVVLGTFGGGANAGLFGSSGMDRDCMAKKSKAWCALDAAKLSKDLSDISASDLPKDGVRTSSTGQAVMSVGIMSGLFGATTLSDMRLSQVSLYNFVVNTGPIAGKENFGFGWVKKEDYKDGLDAKAGVRKLMNEAFADLVKDRILRDSVFYFDKDKVELGQARFAYELSGENCGGNGCFLVFGSVYAEYSRSGGGESCKSPEWLGGEDSWCFNMTNRLEAPRVYENGEDVTFKYMSELSKRLPKGVFLNSGMENKMARSNKGKRMITVMNEGKTHVLVFPEVEVRD